MWEKNTKNISKIEEREDCIQILHQIKIQENEASYV